MWLGPSSYPVKIDSSGNVGIGTIPSYKLHVNGQLGVTTASQGTMRFVSSGSKNFIQSGNAAFDGNADMTIGGYAGHLGSNLNLEFSTVNATSNLKVKSLLFMNYGAEGIYLTGTGINWHNTSDTWTKSIMSFASTGATTINGNLTVSGSITASAGLATNYIELKASTPFIDFHFNNSTADYTSRIIESASGTLTVWTNLIAKGEVTASSDERKKDIIRSTQFNIRDIASARSVIYKWNDDRDNGCEKKIHGGSIAQDWIGKADSFLSQDGEGWYSINYGALALC